mmetsp:Transcript_26290/g.61610  ORF Transcript_26290/g.61610 Transcript_26290/m.61610 type:complete len:91 (+) Transcript_26290:871-1143(+)
MDSSVDSLTRDDFRCLSAFDARDSIQKCIWFQGKSIYCCIAARTIPSRGISSIADENCPPEEITELEDENENKVEDDRDSQIAKDNAANV